MTAAMSSPLVTIIVPVFNSGLYLCELQESFDAQTFRDFRVVYVDDCSTDDSLLVLQEIARLHEGYVVLRTDKNGGQSVARNRALDWMRETRNMTPYTLFVDSDDVLKSSAIETLYETASRAAADDVFYSGQSFFESEDLKRQFENYVHYYERSGEYPEVYSGPEYMELCERAGDLRVSPCMQFFRTDFLIDNQIRFKEGIIHEDNLFTVSCLLKADRIAYCDEKLYLRRIRPNSTVTKPAGRRNVEGYFVCGLELMALAKKGGGGQCNLSRTQEESLVRFIESCFHNAANIYCELSVAERVLCKSSFGPLDALLFDCFVEKDVVLRDEQAGGDGSFEDGGLPTSRSIPDEAGKVLSVLLGCMRKFARGLRAHA